MRVVKLTLIGVAVLAALQVVTWTAIESGRCSTAAVDATRHFFDLAQKHAVQNRWDVNGRLPAQSFVVSDAVAQELSRDTFDAIVSQAQQFNVQLRTGNGPDQWIVRSIHNNPVFATVEVGHVGRGCASIGPVDYLHVAGLWIRVPDSVSYWIRDRAEDVERFRKAWQANGGQAVALRGRSSESRSG